MSATLKLDRFQLMWLAEGAIGKSHLRWDVYPMFVNDVWPQLTESEREAIFTYIKRDSSWHFNNERPHGDETAKQYFLQMLARFNPANQYVVTLKEGRKKAIVVNDAYYFDGKYYVGWQRYCAPEYIVKVEQKPFLKCSNRFCIARNMCVRNLDHKDGDKYFANDSDWACDNCDMIIVKDGVIDPIAKMVISEEKEHGKE